VRFDVRGPFDPDLLRRDLAVGGTIGKQPVPTNLDWPQPLPTPGPLLLRSQTDRPFT